ncbi:hypothetical protein [Enterobacter sp. C2]|uniref:hypothetical protein n=1 Tax=Enterobacter sp. C2 TaxID=2870346 RepID=UPI001CA443BB|nr:hypothetical protein [Enterobacter sp. C2]
MLVIRTLILSTSIIISGQALAESPNQQALEKALAQWQPFSITTGGHKIIVALPGSSITSEAYETVIMHGVCSHLWTKSIPKSALEDIQQLSITNESKTLGYSFESPLSTCEEMGKLMDQPARIMMMSKTHLFSPAGK